MTRMSNFGILFVVFFFCVPVMRASDYYVSPSGSDSKLGTSPEQAWQSIDKVNSEAFGAGDSIFFEGGKTFRGALKFDAAHGGTPANPVTVGSYGRGRATISSGSNHGLYAHNCAGLVVTNLSFVGSGRTDPNGGSGICFLVDLDGGVKLEHVRIDKVDVSGYRQTGILIGASSASNSGFKDVRITNAEVRDNGDKGIASYGYWPPSGWAHQNIYVGNCRVYNNAGIPGKRPHSGNGIVLAGVDGAIIEFCEAYNNGWLCDAPGGGPVGIWAWEANNVIIQFCEAHHNKTSGGDGGGFDLDGGCVNCVMQYNYSHDNHGAGYLICQFSGAREFRNNVCRYNISENDGIGGRYPMGAIHFYSSGSSGGIQDTKVYNNTVYVSSATRGAGIEIHSGSIYNTAIYNNIIFTVPGKRVIDLSDTSAGWSFQGNCYWSSGDTIEIKWGATRYNSLDAWRSATGQEKVGECDVGFEVDPRLVAPGEGSKLLDLTRPDSLIAYRLRSDSPMIDSGLYLRAKFGIDPGKCDFYRTALPQGEKFDVGAAESTRSRSRATD